MGFFKKVFAFKSLKVAKNPEVGILWLQVECGKCQEIIKVRIDKKTDLQSELLQPGESGCAFTLKKEVLGKRCSNLIEVCLKFDSRYNIISKELKNGKLISP